MNEALLPPDPCTPGSGWIREFFDAAGAALACPGTGEIRNEDETSCF